jgi:hypothetical protein
VTARDQIQYSQLKPETMIAPPRVMARKRILRLTAVGIIVR